MKIGSPFCIAGLTLAISLQQAVAAPFTVTTTSENGVGSLREAITAANALPGADSIGFNIPASDPNCNPTTHVCTIAVSSPLPTISDPVTIDGYTQPGASPNSLVIGDNAVLRIELKGTSGAGSGLV